VKANVRNVVNCLTTVDHATTVHGRGLPWALGTSSAQFTVYRLRQSLTNQLSNCQDGYQTNSRRYHDLLSTGIHDVNKIEDFLDNFISVVVLRFR